MFGLILSDPARDDVLRRQAMDLLCAQLIPFAGFTQAPCPTFPSEREAFLRKAAAALMQPGQCLPLTNTLRHLSEGDALPGNVIRKYVCLQLSLLPYLRPGRTVRQLRGCFLLGDDLLIAPLSEGGRIDAQLPDSTWTEMSTGECVSGHLKRLRQLNAMPVLAKENAVIPVSVEDRKASHDDADRVTLHWFEPGDRAVCTLQDGTSYQLRRQGDVMQAFSDSDKPWHLIVHRHGEEQWIR